MNPNMSIYRRLNPRLLVQVGVGLGLLICLMYLKLPPLNSRLSLMKNWGWISMRRSLGDAFEETTMKNVPINQFQSFKWRNIVQNRNLREKLSKIGPLVNFNFWSKVNTKVKQKKVQSQRSATVSVDSRFSGLGHGSGYKVPNIILMMWCWLGLGLAWLMTWHACVSMTWTRWC